MLVSERRTATRRPRLATARFTWDGRPRTAVMTNVSAVGAFLNSSVIPPPGTRLSLSYDVGALAPLTFRGEVVHTQSALGFGVRWMDAAGGSGDLEKLLRTFLDDNVVCRYDADGRVSWALEPDEPEVVGTPVRCFVRRDEFDATARDITTQNLWVDVPNPSLAVGDGLTLRFPLHGPGGFVRITGRVARLGERGFAVDILRVDERGHSGAFEAYVRSLC